jgi:hypothetical protein
MSVTADDLLDWAFQANDQNECDRRAIISRAYYAAYHRCKDWHSALSPYFGSARINVGVHERLIEQLLNPHLGLPPARRAVSKDLGQRLQDLKDKRVLADYRLSLYLPPTMHAQACTDAEEIFRRAT